MLSVMSAYSNKLVGSADTFTRVFENFEKCYEKSFCSESFEANTNCIFAEE